MMFFNNFKMKCNSLKCIDLSNNLLCHPDNYGIESLKNMLLVNTSITQIIMNNCDLNVHGKLIYNCDNDFYL